jgi:phage terminase large subunit GpA-like protein
VDRDREYFEMLTAEVRVPDYTGTIPRYEWKKKTAGARNEALDCRGGAYAGLQALGITTALRLNREVEKLLALAESRVNAPRMGFGLSLPKAAGSSDPWL